MFASKAFVFCLMAMTLAVCIGAPVFVLQASPLMQPGQTWTRGFLSGENLRLLDSGRYVRQAWCDICPPDMISHGSWHKSGDVVVLTPDRPGARERRLRATTIKNCPMLIPLDEYPVKWISRTTVLGHRGDRCVSRLDSEQYDRLPRNQTCPRPEHN